MTVPETVARNDYGAHIYGELTAPNDSTDQLFLAKLAVEALFALADEFFVPLTVDLKRVSCDVETGYPLSRPVPDHQFQQARRRLLPPGVDGQSIYENVEVHEFDQIDAAVLLQWIGNSLALPSLDSTTRIGWEELVVVTVSARLPAEISDPQSDVIRVAYNRGWIDYPIERAAGNAWVSGPLALFRTVFPFELRFSNEAGFVTMDLALNWTLWSDPDGAGRPDVERGLARLEALGWSISAGHK